MEGLLAFPLEQLPFVIIALIIAFTFHEFAHAYVAYKFGDSTAKDQGRLTLNPIQHLDPIGTLFILIAGFGWARPVPVNRFNFKNPKLAGVLVSLAGPLSNFLIFAVAYGVFFLFSIMGFLSIPTFFVEMFYMIAALNALLFVFNLFPFPPLDGYRIIEDLSPPRIRAKLSQYEQYGVLLFIILVITPLDSYTIWPVMDFVMSAMFQSFNMIYEFIFSLFL